jgi:hypothetical protein
MKYQIITKEYEGPIYQVENAGEAVVNFASSSDFSLDLNTYFTAKLVDEGHLVEATEIEWDLDGIEDEAEAFSIMKNLPKTVGYGEYVEEDEMADRLSDEYGYCVKNFNYHDLTYSRPEHFAGISNYTSSDDDKDQELYVASWLNGKRVEYEYFDLSNFFSDLDNYRDSYPLREAEVIEAKVGGKDVYPKDFGQLLLFLGYEDKEDKFYPNTLIYFDCNREECRFNSVEAFFECWKSGEFGSNIIDDVRINNQKIKCNSLRELAEILDVEDNFAEARFEWDEQRKIEEERNWPEEPTSETYDLTAQDILGVLVETLPTSHKNFPDQTSFGEPQLFVSLPFGRSLEIVYEDTGDNNRFYSFRIHCSDEEFDNEAFQKTNGILAEETADDFSFDTVFSKLDWAIRIAKETPVEKPLKLEIGDEVTITDATKEQRFCYVVDVLENGVKLFDTTVKATTLITDKSMIKKTGHSEMAYNVFS